MPPRDAGARTLDARTKAATRLRWHRRRQAFTRCGPPTARRRPSSVRRVSSNLALTCAQPVARPRRESDACPAASPHAPRPKAVVHPRWNRRLRPRTRRTALRRAPAARVRACRVSGQRKQVNDFGGAAPGAAELTKRSAVSQLATAATRIRQPPLCPPSTRRCAAATHFRFSRIDARLLRANLFGPGHPASRGGFFGKCRMELLCVFTKTLV